VLVAPRFEEGAPLALTKLAVASTFAHLLLVAGEATIPHATAHGRLAAREMTNGRYRHFFRAGVLLQAAAVFAGVVLPESALLAPLALLGLLAHEHAFVQVGQAVPLA